MQPIKPWDTMNTFLGGKLITGSPYIRMSARSHEKPSDISQRP